MRRAPSFARAARGAAAGTGARAFTLIELMIALAILSLLGVVAIRQYTFAIGKAKRTEATTCLYSFFDHQRIFFAENNRFAYDFADLGFAIEGGEIDPEDPKVITGDRLRYAYGMDNVMGAYVGFASGNLDDDSFPDVLGVEDHQWLGVQDEVIRSVYVVWDDLLDTTADDTPPE